MYVLSLPLSPWKFWGHCCFYFVPSKDCILETLHIPERSMGAPKLCGRETNRALTPLPRTLPRVRTRWWLSVRAHGLSNNFYCCSNISDYVDIETIFLIVSTCVPCAMRPVNAPSKHRLRGCVNYTSSTTACIHRIVTSI